MSLIDEMCGLPRNDVALSEPDYFVSYNPDTRAGMFGDADGGEETALVLHDYPHGKDGHSWTGDAYFILKGDFREDYAALASEGRWGLKRFYDEHKKAHGSRHSTDFHEWGTDGKRRRRMRRKNPL